MTRATGSTAHRAMCRMAARVYLLRQSGEEEPHGEYRFGGGWLPANYEQCDCCERFFNVYRYPQANLRRHCCSLKHVAAVYELPLADVRAALREIRKG